MECDVVQFTLRMGTHLFTYFGRLVCKIIFYVCFLQVTQVLYVEGNRLSVFSQEASYPSFLSFLIIGSNVWVPRFWCLDSLHLDYWMLPQSVIKINF